MGLRVLVCGGRTYGWRLHPDGRRERNEGQISELMAWLDGSGATKIGEGGARGADEWARFWAEIRGVPCQTWRADWARHGRAAGPLRNRQMFHEFQPELVLAAPGGPGTADMIAVAEAAGVPVLRIPS